MLSDSFLTILSATDAGGSGSIPPAGQVARSVNFPGTGGSYLTSENDFPIDIGSDYTLAVWVRPTSLGSPSNSRGVIGKGVSLAVPATFVFGIDVNYTFDRVDAYHSDGTTVTTLSSADSSLTDATWAFVVVKFDADTLSLSINGGTAVTATGLNSLAGALADTLLGSLTSTGIDTFLGQLSMLGLWRRALSGAEITTLYNAGKGTAYANLSVGLLNSLTGYFNLDESSDGSGAVSRDDDSDGDTGSFTDSAQVPSSTQVPS